MSALAHAILYTLLISTSLISTVAKPGQRAEYRNQDFEALGAAVELAELSPIKETQSEYFIKDDTVCVYDVYTKENMYMSLEEYVRGVMLAEAPSWYEKEALRALAVAIRTYTVNKAQNPAHESGADVCTSASHCQAFYSVQEAGSVWTQKSAADAYEKMKSAAEETEGQILLYEGTPILAMYHASSYLYTKAFGDVEYLQSVFVPFENDTTSRKFEKEFSAEECAQLLSKELDIPKPADLQLSAEWEKNRCVGMRVVCGSQSCLVLPDRVRSLFSLSSPNFMIEKSDDKYLFRSFGYGHGIGLSQEGANLMAQDGKDYRQILFHYYTDTNLAKLKFFE